MVQHKTNVYVESHLQLNFHTGGSEPETLVIRTFDKQKQLQRYVTENY